MYSKLNQMKEKLWVALLIWGGAAFFPLSFMAVLLWLVFLVFFFLVWCLQSLRSIWSGIFLSLLFLCVACFCQQFLVGGAAFPSSFLVVLPPSTSFGLCCRCPFLELN